MRLGERPWGPLLGDLGARAFSGRVEIQSGDKKFAIVFQRGAVIDAQSPLPADSALRAALTGHFISPSVVPAINRRIANTPDRDDVTIVADAARLPTEHARRLRTRVVLARAARTFALEDGEVDIVEDPMPGAAMPVCAVDVRAVVYHGARMHLSELRLAAEIRTVGGMFTLKPDAPLAAYALSDAERVVVDALRGGTTIAELEAKYRELDPRAIQVVVYTLVSCGAVRGNVASGSSPAIPRAATPAAPRTITRQPLTSATSVGIGVGVGASGGASGAPASPTSPRNVTAASAPTPTPAPAPPSPPRTTTPSTTPPINVQRTLSPRASIADLTTLVATRTQLLDHGADFFALLGLANDAPQETIRVAHLRIASLLQPSHLATVGYDDGDGAAKRLLEQVEVAFHVLNDPARRAAYLATLSRTITQDALMRAARARTYEEYAARTPAAEAFNRGQLALRADHAAKAAVEFQTASELEPSNYEYQVMAAFAKFCAAADRDAASVETRRVLERGINKSEHPVLARYYLGRVERMLGRERDALRHFREVLELQPEHAEAASEVRVLEARVEGRASKK